MNFIIVHGAYGNPEENWLPWLKTKLQDLGHKVILPKFPTPEGQSLDSWMQILDNHPIDSETVLIGHSLGCALILKKLEKITAPAKGVFLVAGFIGTLNKKEFDELNKSFFETKFDWDLINQNSDCFAVFNSDNDPYVPEEKGKQLADKLSAELITVKNAGHFNESAGYKEFELLLSKIKELL